MKNLLKKSLLAGIGVISMTKDKAEFVAKELMERGEVTKEEANDLVEELMQKGEEEQKAVRENLLQELEDFKKRMGLLTKEDLKVLEERISRLEAHLTTKDQA